MHTSQEGLLLAARSPCRLAASARLTGRRLSWTQSLSNGPGLAPGATSGQKISRLAGATSGGSCVEHGVAAVTGCAPRDGAAARLNESIELRHKLVYALWLPLDRFRASFVHKTQTSSIFTDTRLIERLERAHTRLDRAEQSSHQARKTRAPRCRRRRRPQGQHEGVYELHPQSFQIWIHVPMLHRVLPTAAHRFDHTGCVSVRAPRRREGQAPRAQASLGTRAA